MGNKLIYMGRKQVEMYLLSDKIMSFKGLKKV